MKTIKATNIYAIPEDYTGIVELSNGSKEWYMNGKRHRETGPCTMCKDCLEGNFKLCLKPGPAIEYPDGSKFWYINGKYHREDGPAVEYSDGKKYWYLNGKLHRETGPCTMCKDCLEGNFKLCLKPGPAIVYPSGLKLWYLYDVELTKKQHKHFVHLIKLGYPQNIIVWLINNKGLT